MKKRDKELVEILKDLDNHSGADYKGEKLTGLDLSGKDFSKANLSGCNFLNSNLAGCDFSSANLTDTIFTCANISGAHFDGAIRNGKQILKYASISTNKISIYGFLVKDKVERVMINEPNKPEYEFKMQDAKHEARVLYNLLVNG